jgi:hypothetical protein
VVGATLAWLVFGWASRRTNRRGPARSLCTGLFVTAMVLWWGPVILAAPAG